MINSRPPLSSHILTLAEAAFLKGWCQHRCSIIQLVLLQRKPRNEGASFESNLLTLHFYRRFDMLSHDMHDGHTNVGCRRSWIGQPSARSINVMSVNLRGKHNRVYKTAIFDQTHSILAYGLSRKREATWTGVYQVVLVHPGTMIFTQTPILP